LILRGGEAVPAVLDALICEDYRARVAAVEFFDVTAVEETCHRLIPFLDEQNHTEVKAGLARILGRLRYEDAIGALRLLISDESSAVRAAVVEALGELGDKDSEEKIVALLCDDFAEVRIAAAGALGELDAKGRGEAVLEAYLKEGDPGAAEALVEALGRLKVDDAVSVLAPCFENEDAAIFPYAVRAVGRIGGEEAVLALIELLERVNAPDMIDLVSGAVADLGESAMPLLRDKLGEMSEDIDGRWKVLNAYAKMGRFATRDLIDFIEAEPYPFFKDSASKMLIEFVEREYGVSLPDRDYRLIYDESWREWDRKIANWEKWWASQKDAGER
jgi:HEAT repeat protein